MAHYKVREYLTEKEVERQPTRPDLPGNEPSLGHGRAQASVQVVFVPTDDGLPRPSQSEPNDPQQKWRRSAGDKLNVQRNSGRLHRL
jgi:hypothetical protein